MRLTLHKFSANWAVNWGGLMGRSAQALASVLLLSSAGLLAACGNSASGLTTGATPPAGELPAAINNEDPLARPVAVAWTSARAQRCGFYFDPTKLRATYLAYEAKQSGGEQLAKAEKSYDSTFKIIRDRVSSDPDYCTDRKGREIKTELQRHLAGDFTPKLPQAKKVETCGMWGCPPEVSDEPFNAKKMYEDLDRKQNK
ncbi:MAG: hypothetical protein HC869_25935 [Rhodospirillales bacterium]|nr:hypothetical protein [Rhodospirillales bacterium]